VIAFLVTVVVFIFSWFLFQPPIFSPAWFFFLVVAALVGVLIQAISDVDR